MTLDLMLIDCHRLSQDKSRAALDLLGTLREYDVVFLPIANAIDTEPHPEKEIDAVGGIRLGVEHRSLGKGFGHFLGKKRKPREHGSANMYFAGPLGGFVSIAQNTDTQEPPSWDPLANSLWQFGLMLYPHLKPDYCVLDQMGEESITDVSALQLKRLYWRNIFGPRYVEKHGREFFLSAPGWKVKELEDGSIMYMPEESYLNWVTKPPSPLVKEAVNYFKQKFPKIKQFRAKPVDLPYEISRVILTKESGEEEVVYERPQKKNKKKRPHRNSSKNKLKPEE